MTQHRPGEVERDACFLHRESAGDYTAARRMAMRAGAYERPGHWSAVAGLLTKMEEAYMATRAALMLRREDARILGEG